MEKVETFSEAARELIDEKDLTRLKQLLSDMPAGEIVDGLDALDIDERPVVFRLLPKEKAVEVFDMLDAAVQGDLLESFTDKQQVEFLGTLDPDDRVHLLDELPARVARSLLERLPREKRDSTNALPGYEDGTVGRITNNESDVCRCEAPHERNVMAARIPFLLITLAGGMLAGAVVDARWSMR